MTTPPTEAMPTEETSGLPGFLRWLPWEKVLIWGLLLVVVIALSHFFPVIFLTFIISYLMRNLILWIMSYLPVRLRTVWTERILAVLCFLLLLAGLYGIGSFFGPRLARQGQELVSRANRVDAEKEFSSFLSRTMGEYLFTKAYGSRYDSKFQEELEKFREEGSLRVGAYDDFPALSSKVEGPFESQFETTEKDRISAEVAKRAADTAAFEEWFESKKAPGIRERYRERPSEFRSAKTMQDALDDQKKSDKTKREWEEHVRTTLRSEYGAWPTFNERFRQFYKRHHLDEPTGLPANVEDYEKLKEAHRSGLKEFSKQLQEIEGLDEKQSRVQAADDLQRQRQYDLAQQWWEESPTAGFVRESVSKSVEEMSKLVPIWLRTGIRWIVTASVQLSLSLLLSFFITFDIPKIKKGLSRLRQSRARPLYDELAPSLISFGVLIGRAFWAQGMIAVCNTVLTFIAIKMIGIQNEVFLAAIVFICSFIPVVGVVLSSVPICIMAIVQPGGTIWMAIWALAAILIVHFLETSIFNPKIIGDMLHLHPVLVLTVLALGEHFFGVWGLLLASPVTVYIIRFVILDEGVPGLIEPMHVIRRRLMEDSPAA